ncbi:RNA polymerase sigma-70 factor [Niallia oryzisoli]|uniref:RNA polymerase sigma-70 factor n=1 Tax=Niallia oryzisoli TaxID=1737571 RepID=A0ABZ2C9P8_9BACI
MSISKEEIIFKQYRALLFSISYRMLGSVTEAEDIVQETFLSYFQHDTGAVKNEKAYLCKMAINLCLDTLKSARKKREVYVGPWLPEPILTPVEQDDPADQAIAKESLSFSYLLLMEKLSPVERAVFLLREVFGFSYREIGEIVTKTEANCRKIFTRLKEKIGAEVQVTTLNNDKNQTIISEFIQAFQNGDMEKIMTLVSEEVVLYSDGGGIVKAAIKPIYSRNHVLSFLTGIAAKAPADLITKFQNINGQLGVVNYINSYPHSVISFQDQNEQITNIYINPEKLQWR